MPINIFKLKAKDLIWEKGNREHIKKHNLNPRQVEQVLSDKNKIEDKGHSGRLSIIGRCGKRLLAVFIVPEGKKFYVVTARDASRKERQSYYHYEKS